MRRIAETAAGVVTAAAMIAYPLAGRGSAARQVLSNAVVGGLAATTTAGSIMRWGVARTIVAGKLVALGTLAIEHFGTRTSFPFGRYEYTGRLRPAIAGVPVARPAGVVGDGRARARGRTRRARCPLVADAGGSPLGSVALGAWDLFLDPQMTARGLLALDASAAATGGSRSPTSPAGWSPGSP